AGRASKYRIYGARGLHPRFMRAAHEAEYNRHPKLARSGISAPDPSLEAQLARRDAEWRLADLVIANSELTRRAHLEHGLDADKVRVVPLGFPEPFAGEWPRPVRDTPLRVLWAGNFSVLK